MNTTRRYERTASAAFKGYDYASAIEKPAPRLADRAVNWALFVGVIAIIFSIIFGVAP